MSFFGDQFQIFNPVVLLVSIFMVNNFPDGQQPPEMLRHYQPMFSDSSIDIRHCAKRMGFRKRDDTIAGIIDCKSAFVKMRFRSSRTFGSGRVGEKDIATRRTPETSLSKLTCVN